MSAGLEFEPIPFLKVCFKNLWSFHWLWSTNNILGTRGCCAASLEHGARDTVKHGLLLSSKQALSNSASCSCNSSKFDNEFAIVTTVRGDRWLWSSVGNGTERVTFPARHRRSSATSSLPEITVRVNYPIACGLNPFLFPFDCLLTSEHTQGEFIDSRLQHAA